MMIEAFAFYLFAGILLLSGLMVITARNPVHSVLFLILSFFNASGLFVLLGAEFIAFILVIVYVGAVAVLFLFVVMMLDINFKDLRTGATRYASVGLFVAAILLAEFVMVYTSWQFADDYALNRAVPNAKYIDFTNTEALGQILYVNYVLAFQLAGLILFVAMIGSIVLTLRVRPGVRRQDISLQHARTPSDAMEIQKVTTGSGA